MEEIRFYKNREIRSKKGVMMGRKSNCKRKIGEKLGIREKGFLGILYSEEKG